MTLARALAALLRRSGYRLTPAVREALSDFVAVVGEEDPDHDSDTMDEDEGLDEADDDSEDGVGEADDDSEDGEDDLARNEAITCPHCGEPIEVAVDLSAGDQDGIQDCSVCCRPIRIRYSADHGRLGSFSADPA